MSRARRGSRAPRKVNLARTRRATANLDSGASGRAANLPDRPMTAVADPLYALDALGVLADAQARSAETLELAQHHLDSSLVDMLRILGFDKEYVSAQGSYLYDAD